MGLKAKILYDWNILRIRYWWKKNKLIKPLYENILGESKNPGIVIYMCDGRIMCGGLCDRLHGILSLYAFCKNKGIPYKINFCEPFRLKEYLAPNVVDWDIEPDELCYDMHGAEPMLMFCSSRKNGATMQQEANFMYRYLEHEVKAKNSKEYHIYTNMHYACHPDMYSDLFHELFRPTESLQEAITWNKKKIGNRYVSVTLRFQNLLGDFKEGKYPTLSGKQQKTLIEKVKEKIKELHREKHPDMKILITSDSRKFLDEINKEEWSYTIPGKLVHMSYTPVHDFETHLKSFLDLFMLADAEKLYLLTTEKMYHSGFAKSASLINNKPYEEIFF